MRSRQLVTAGHLTLADDSVAGNREFMVQAVFDSLLFMWTSRARSCALESLCPPRSGSGEAFFCPDGIDGNQRSEVVWSKGSLGAENEQPFSIPSEAEEHTGLAHGGPRCRHEHMHTEPNGWRDTVGRLVVSSAQCACRLAAFLIPLRRADIPSARFGFYTFKCSHSMF